jgi:dolichyl-phosphate beta-glucosyltransferase
LDRSETLEPMKLTAVIPTFREENKIAASIGKVGKALESTKQDFEIIVVDNASDDSTVREARRTESDWPVRVLVNETNMGKGYSVRKGLLEGTGAWRFFLDADLSTPPEEIPRFFTLAKEGDFGVLVGSRLAPGAQVIRSQSIVRRLAGQACLTLTRSLLPGMPRDVYCGFKWFRGDLVEPLFLPQKTFGWTFDAEVLARAHRLGVRVLEVPICWENDPHSKLSVSRDMIGIVTDLLRARRAVMKAPQKDPQGDRWASPQG